MSITVTMKNGTIHEGCKEVKYEKVFGKTYLVAYWLWFKLCLEPTEVKTVVVED